MTKKHDHQAILQELGNLEQELKALELWGGMEAHPSEKAMASIQPFALDTMEFHQWLEYVLIVRLREMIANSAQLPAAMMVHTYAQEQYRGQWTKYRNLIGILQKLDRLITLEKPKH